jgi:Kelch motif
MPKARRRHSSVVIDDCILIFGGYNGKYLNDFHFLKIEEG